MIHSSKKTIYTIAIAATLALCAFSIKPSNDPVFKNLDKSVKPGDDFFMYANGGWIKENPIPPAYSSWGIGNVVGEEIKVRLKKIVEDAMAANAPKGTATQKIGDFYYSGLDTVTIEKAGITPLQPMLAMIDNIKDVKDLVHVSSYLNTYGTRSFIGAGVGQDAKNSSKNVVQLRQGGIGLPNRDYYFRTDARTTRVRDEYRTKHLPAMLMLSGWDAQTAAKGAESVFKIEKYLAENNRKLEDNRDPYRNYNKMTVAKLGELTPEINWTDVFNTMELKAVDSVIVAQPEYYTAVNTALKTFTIDDWKAYLRWKLISGNAAYLTKAIEDENFRFTGTVISGRKEQLPRWKRVLDNENSIMGEILGQLFVKEYFSLQAKERYTKMVEAMRSAYREHIEKLDWMSPATKQKALIKLNAVHPKVGYPDKWKDYSTLIIDRSSYVGNVIRARHSAYLISVAKLGKPVNHQEWGMTPQTYNASYSPSNNEITLPAAQFIIPGVKDADVDDAVAYGYAAASTIGHEMTHGFDDEGRQFDAKGNLKAWWTPQDSTKFTKRANMLADQFSGYVVLDSLHVNGKATLGENIADLGGIVIGITAFKKPNNTSRVKALTALRPCSVSF